MTELNDIINKVQDKLIEEFDGKSYCVGELSSSALSTAVSCLALGTIDKKAYAEEQSEARQWLILNQNKDGGWGDTTDSPSNISTSFLVWAAFNNSEFENEARLWSI